MSSFTKTATCFSWLAFVAIASSSRAALVFLSPVASIGGGVTTSPPSLTYPADSSVKSLYIWVEDDIQAGQGFAVNLGISGTPGVIAFTGARALNPAINVGTTSIGTRWGSVSIFNVGSTSNATATSIINLNSVSTNSTGGIRPANNGSPFLDTGFDIPAGAFLWGRVDFQILAPGTATISLLDSANPIVADGGLDVSNSFTYSSAAITVSAIPEPTTWGLAVVGLLGAGWWRTRRVK